MLLRVLQGDQIWNPENQESNVSMVCPGHDRWGIGKIVFIMCDDFATQLFHFPWWHEWSSVLLPVFEELKVLPRHMADALSTPLLLCSALRLFAVHCLRVSFIALVLLLTNKSCLLC